MPPGKEPDGEDAKELDEDTSSPAIINVAAATLAAPTTKEVVEETKDKAESNKPIAVGDNKDDEYKLSLGQFSPYAENNELVDRSTPSLPGAENVPGIVAAAADEARRAPPDPTLEQLSQSNVVQAFLVEDDEEANHIVRDDGGGPQDNDENLPVMAAKAVEYKPWYKRKDVMVLLILSILALIGIIVGVVIGTRSSGGGNNPVDTMSPTSSPAPTATGTVTLVIQLDKAPQETGWKLECEGSEIQSVPEGSYAFLPIGVLIPSFRMQVTNEVVAGSDCVYNITDAGGDGLVGGFYEIYYGDNVGMAQNRIARGVPQSSPTLIPFTVELPPMDELTPTVAPAPPTASPTIEFMCTLCPDGSPVPDTDKFIVLEELDLTCGVLELVAKATFDSSICKERIQPLAPSCGCPDASNNAPAPPASQPCTVCLDGSPVTAPNLFLSESGLTCAELELAATNVTIDSGQCQEEFQAFATDCGCENFCDTLCPDGSFIDESQEETLVRVDRGFPVTCGDLQEQVKVRKSTASDCLTAGFIGEEICMCPSEGMFCRICEPGGPTRVPGNLSREIIPGIACEDISGIAFSLLRSDPRFSLICPACLGIGAYCGCPQVENPRTFCRLCGGTNDLLPVPDRLVFSPTLNQTTTCFHVEFFSNLGIAPNGTTNVDIISSCSVVQEESAAECCTP